MSRAKPQIRTRQGNPVEYQSVRYDERMPLRSDGAEVLYHEYGVQLRRTINGEYILNVLCGRVGQYGVEIALTQLEIDKYGDDDGDTFIHNLGEDVHNDSNAFASRVVRTC